MPDSNQKRVPLYISDEAYQGVIALAEQHGYKLSSYNPRGISEYVTWLLEACTFEDTRPPDVAGDDAAMMEAGIAPEWRIHGPRKRRNLNIGTDTLALASVEAFALGIAAAPARRLTGAPTYLDSAQCLAALLEAIGTGWVTPHVKEAANP